jgi:RNA recognition motif-containing protein
MEKKLYVGNLDWSVTNEELAELFSTSGTVLKVEVITFRETGKSRGFGFITMATPEETDHALKLDGSTLKSRQIAVRVALPEGEHKTKRNELTPFFDFINSIDPGKEELLFSYKGKEFKIKALPVVVHSTKKATEGAEKVDFKDLI